MLITPLIRIPYLGALLEVLIQRRHQARCARKRAQALMQLANLDDHLLRDIGLSRSDIFEASRCVGSSTGEYLHHRRGQI